MQRRMIFIKRIMIACALLAAWMPTSGQEIDGGKICAYATWGDKACGMDEEMACPMLSVMKFPQALYVANCLKRSGQALDTETTVRKRKLMKNTWSPMLEGMGRKQKFTYGELLRLSLQESDNNACDLLFKVFGGPDRVQDYMASLGMSDIHIGATERQMMLDPGKSALNTSSPREMVSLLEWFYSHRNDDAWLTYVWNLMAGCRTGMARIPSAVGPDDVVVHKTGTGFPTTKGISAINDAGIIIHPDGTHTIMAIFALDFPDAPTAEKALRQKVMEMEAMRHEE